MGCVHGENPMIQLQIGNVDEDGLRPEFTCSDRTSLQPWSISTETIKIRKLLMALKSRLSSTLLHIRPCIQTMWSTLKVLFGSILVSSVTLFMCRGVLLQVEEASFAHEVVCNTEAVRQLDIVDRLLDRRPFH